mmetsp:Transcript_3022/g.5870  ORF Transcript_3022/g.5870 Transcript_3022/m.5870 type:complete len:130 (+) Transcript_3022:93-482(+)
MASGAKFRRRKRALRRGYIDSVPRGHVHILVRKDLEQRVRAQLAAFELHQDCNTLSGCDHHLLAHAILATQATLGRSFSQQAFGIRKKADAAPHVWDASLAEVAAVSYYTTDFAKINFEYVDEVCDESC